MTSHHVIHSLTVGYSGDLFTEDPGHARTMYGGVRVCTKSLNHARTGPYICMGMYTGMISSLFLG